MQLNVQHPSQLSKHIQFVTIDSVFVYSGLLSLSSANIYLL